MKNRLKIGGVLLITFWSLAAMAETLTVGGRVGDAADSTTADGASWLLYALEDSATRATGTVGTYASGYWAGEAGTVLGDFALGDELISVVQRENAQGTLAHAGYYAVMDHTLDGSDPANFQSMTLRSVPVPSVSLAPGYVAQLNWSQAAEDSSNGNIVGYHLHRSSDGISFTQLTSTPLAGSSYTDIGFPADTRHYALSLVYRGQPMVEVDLISENSVLMLDTDGDSVDDAIDNCFDLSNFGQENHDDDAQGDACDLDDDDDGMPDSYEEVMGFDLLDSDDALLDDDDDGESNLDEYKNETDPRDPHSNMRSRHAVISIINMLME